MLCIKGLQPALSLCICGSRPLLHTQEMRPAASAVSESTVNASKKQDYLWAQDVGPRPRCKALLSCRLAAMHALRARAAQLASSPGGSCRPALS